MPYSKEGFTWTPSGGMREGLPSIGVISPSTHFVQPKDDLFDTIVIGTGYAGLVASRDLATQGKKTLVIEARDRLGGRTWTSSINGFNYEMGGTWIHWHMPHIYREVSFYGLHNDWLVTQIAGGKEDYCTLTTDNGQRNMSHDAEVDIVGRVFRAFANVDGECLRHAWKYPFGTGQSPELMAKWDQLSCQDRLDQLQGQLTPDEISVLKAFLVQAGGNDLDRLGLLDALRWWVLGSHSPTGLNDIALHTRLGSGNSELHRRIFQHARSTGNLSYRFDTQVTRIEENEGLVTVTARDGQTWKAKAVVLTVPLNVLSSIEFSPPLPKDKQDAARQGSVNLCNKLHLDIKGPDWVSWSSFSSPGKGTVAAFGDQLTPANNTHLVAFGPDPNSSTGIPLEDMEAVRDSIAHLLPKDKRSGVSHDWNKDEFSRGAWCFLPPNFTTKYLTALQKPHGNVLFASGDWSDGWRGWIDGAVQIGMKAAQQVIMLQQKPDGDGMSGFYAVQQQLVNGVAKETLFTTLNESWHARIKRPVANAYSMTTLTDYEPLVDRTIEDLFLQLDQRYCSTGMQCPIFEWLQFYTFDVIGELTCSKSFGFVTDGRDVGGIIDSLNKTMDYNAIIGQLPWLDHWLKKNPIWTQLARPNGAVADFARQRLDERLSAECSDSSKDSHSIIDFVDRFFRPKELYPEIVDDGQILSYMITNMFAGSDTTAISLRAIIYYILRHPNTYKRLMRELGDAYVSGKLSVPVKWRESQQLPFFNAVVSEALRLHPAVGLILERLVPEEGLELSSGAVLPPGTIVGASPWVMHRDESVWGGERGRFQA
ncbi:hypothetical protein ACJ41O_011896 [Fusarium nematophilum]